MAEKETTFFERDPEAGSGLTLGPDRPAPRASFGAGKGSRAAAQDLSEAMIASQGARKRHGAAKRRTCVIVPIGKCLWANDNWSYVEHGDRANCDIKVTQDDQLRPGAAALQPKSSGIVRSQPAHPPFIFWLNCGFSATDTGLTVLARKLGFP